MMHYTLNFSPKNTNFPGDTLTIISLSNIAFARQFLY